MRDCGELDWLGVNWCRGVSWEREWGDWGFEMGRRGTMQQGRVARRDEGLLARSDDSDGRRRWAIVRCLAILSYL